MSQTDKLPSNRLVKWQCNQNLVHETFVFFPVGFDPSQDEQLKKFGPWNLVQNKLTEA